MKEGKKGLHDCRPDDTNHNDAQPNSDHNETHSMMTLHMGTCGITTCIKSKR